MSFRVLLFIAAVAIAILTQGCSGIIAGSGKRYEYLMKPSTSSERIAEKLGAPVAEFLYEPAIPVLRTPEFRGYEERVGRSPFVWGTTNEAYMAMVRSGAVYSRKGPFEDGDRAQVYGMGFAMTFGLAEPFMLIPAIVERRKLNDETFSITVWYDARGYYAGYFKGDIRCGASVPDKSLTYPDPYAP